MKERRKYTKLEILSVLSCLVGCSFLAAIKLVDSELDLFSLGLIFNGIGIAAMLFGKKAGKA